MGRSGKQSAGAVVSHSTARAAATSFEKKKTEKRVVCASRDKLAGKKSQGGQKSQLVVKSGKVAHERVSYEEEKIRVKVEISSNSRIYAKAESSRKVGRTQAERITTEIRMESKKKTSTISSSTKTRAQTVDFRGKSSKGAARLETGVMKRNEKQQILQSKSSSNICLLGSLVIAEKPDPRMPYFLL